MGATGSDVEAGFAKLQGEDFEYYMQTYSIVLGRNSKKSSVDVDLSSLGGGMNISRNHARIFYDFTRRRFALEVLGKNGCFVEGVLHLPGTPPVKLDSQDLLQIGDKEFYFLLPVRSILGGQLGPRQNVPAALQYGYQSGGSGSERLSVGGGKKGKVREIYNGEEYDEDDEIGGGGRSSGGKKFRREGFDGYGYATSGLSGGKGSSGALGHMETKVEARSRADCEADEKDVVSSVATVLSDVCGPGEWMPMEKLHSELVEQFHDVWHYYLVKRYLTSEDCSSPEAKGKPWYGLLMLLRKYPEHFVINTRSKGRVKLEFVSLVSLIS